MSTILFPAGLNMDFTHLNMEEMEFYAQAWNLERIQMEKGAYRGSLKVTHTPHMQLMRTPHSHGLLIQGDFPKGTVLIAFILTKADVVFKNKIADSHEVKILKSGDEIDFLCNGKSETFTIAVQEQFFYEAYYSYFGQDFNSSQKDKKIYINAQSFAHFIQGFNQWMHYLMHEHQGLAIPIPYEQIEAEILEHLFSHIEVTELEKFRHKFEIQKARDIIDQSIDNPLSIGHLADTLKVSERLLHHAFKVNYGITPQKYLLHLRMHTVKQELLRSNPEVTTISAIIEKHHFYNQSTFTQAYRQMFSELPSYTFNRFE